MKRVFGVIGAASLFVLIIAANIVRLPYLSIGPGPANEVVPLIQVSGHPTYDTGHLIMTTVSFRELTAVGMLRAWLDRDQSVVSRSTFYGDDTVAEEQQRAQSQMDQSKIDAATVVLSHLDGYPKEHGDGVLVESVGSGCPAEGKLFAGDLILAIDDNPIHTLNQASSVMGAVPSGIAADFSVRAAGKDSVVTVKKGSCPGVDHPVFGISPVPAFPFQVTIRSGEIGGPSAGLMYSLGLYDLLTPGDLTQGRIVAGTGTIAPDGTVGPIGGITDKIVAARDVGAEVFLCPKDNYVEAKTADAGSMTLIPVSSFSEALAYLSDGTVPS